MGARKIGGGCGRAMDGDCGVLSVIVLSVLELNLVTRIHSIDEDFRFLFWKIFYCKINMKFI